MRNKLTFTTITSHSSQERKLKKKQESAKIYGLA
jgi:hypothetical protein